MSTTETTDNVMKTAVKQERNVHKRYTSNQGKGEDANITCFKCGIRGHKARKCSRKVWFNFCKSNTHQESLCRKKDKQDNARKVTDEEASDYFFKAAQTKGDGSISKVKMKGIMVDAGATSHIVNDIKTFQSFDGTFRTETHSVELADGTRCSGMAQGKGTAMIHLLDSDGRQHRA